MLKKERKNVWNQQLYVLALENALTTHFAYELCDGRLANDWLEPGQLQKELSTGYVYIAFKYESNASSDPMNRTRRASTNQTHRATTNQMRQATTNQTRRATTNRKERPGIERVERPQIKHVERPRIKCVERPGIELMERPGIEPV